ncbi:MAG TPA: flagellar biosynthetic protein FliO [Bryobacteraceae bacterium]|nr:flagellar biosynthetic protein FliO [Bryobacteraceae bacterium]
MDIVRQSLAITFVFALLWLALWLLRRRGSLRFGFPKGRADHSLLESRAKLALSAQHSVHLVRIGQRELLVAVHPSGVTLLCDMSSGSGGPA